jgi:hypothetical protein
MKETKDKVGTLIHDDCHITTSELCSAIGIGKPMIVATIRKLGYRKICTQWVLKMLTVKHKNSPKKTSVQNSSSKLRKMEMLFCQE